MLDKVKPTIKNTEKIDDIHAECEWEVMLWGDIELSVFTKHVITRENREPDVDLYELEIDMHGEVTRTLFNADYTDIHNAFNDCYGSIDAFIKEQTGCEVLSGMELAE